MKNILFVVIVILAIAITTPVSADKGRICLRDGKSERVTEFNYEAVNNTTAINDIRTGQKNNEAVVILKGIISGQFRMGNACIIEDIGFVNQLAILQVIISCRPIFGIQ